MQKCEFRKAQRQKSIIIKSFEYLFANVSNNNDKYLIGSCCKRYSYEIKRKKVIN